MESLRCDPQLHSELKTSLSYAMPYMMVTVVNSADSSTTWKTCLWEIILITLVSELWHHSLAGIQDGINGDGELNGSSHSWLSDFLLWRPCDQLLQAPVTSTSHHDRLYS